MRRMLVSEHFSNTREIAMNQRVNISTFKYAIISTGFRRQVIALTSHLHFAQRSLGGMHSIVETKEIEAFKVNSSVGRDSASKGYIGYDTVDSKTNIKDVIIS